MEKLPTAEELAALMYADGSYEELIDPVKFAASVAITLTKLHVEAALKEVINNAKCQLAGDGCNPDEQEVDKDSILNSYPLDKIK